MSLLLHLINIQQMLFVVPNIKKTRLLSIIITLELQGKKKVIFSPLYIFQIFYNEGFAFHWFRSFCCTHGVILRNILRSYKICMTIIGLGDNFTQPAFTRFPYDTHTKIHIHTQLNILCIIFKIQVWEFRHRKSVCVSM